ncbi:MAG: DUF2207 domain-containing protein [Candidatus Methanoperedens sp.]|nr:DUF2207 domain-containing protein [Candidatus Methanoperedens sp.]
MTEERQLIVPFAVIFIIGIAGYLMAAYIPYSGDLVVENYNVSISPEDYLTETYIYDVGISGKYSMLFRVWKAPIIAPDGEDLDRPHIKVSNISCLQGSTPYVKDHTGRVRATDGSTSSIIGEKAYDNEVGCYFPGMYREGIHAISASYRIYPPVECDDSFCRLDLTLADEHIPYRKVKIILPDTGVMKVFPHPPDFTVSKSPGKWVISGKSPENGLIEVEMLIKKDGDVRYSTKLNEIEEKTVSSNSWYSNIYLLLSALKYILLSIILGFPVILYFIYRKTGTEKGFTVPEYLSYIPLKRKPWFVNLVFNKDAFDFDENGFYATLLDLQKRGYVRIETFADKKEKEVVITLLKNTEDGDDIYEKDVLSFLKDWSKDGVFRTKEFKEQVKSISTQRESIISLKKRMDKIMRRAYPAYAGELVVEGRRKFFIISGISALAAFMFDSNYSSMYPIFREIAIFSGTLAVQSGIIAFLTPSTLFGRWKGEYYKEKLEWDAFRKFLSDMAMMKRYLPEDVIIWKEWLIYGTALGVGENVIKAMNALNVVFPEVSTASSVYYSFHSVNSSVASAYSAATGGGGGGGGFGGGGAGGR